MIVFSSALLGVTGIILLPCLVLLVQVLAALTVSRRRALNALERVKPTSAPLDVCLLMPAHNESGGIAAVLRTLQPQLGAHQRLLVVADNCTDDTAEIVRMCAGLSGFVEVIERYNEDLRGKGYALDHGVRHLESDPPDVVIILDADCEMTPGSVEALTQQCFASNRPAQALNLMRSPTGAGIKTQLAEFAWLVKNKVRVLGYYNLGLPCQLMGTGMAFTWSHISQAELNTGHIVEDMQLGVDLARNGKPPQFCPDALVTSVFPVAAEGLKNQRTRWEHGHLSVIFTQVPQLLWQACTTANGQLFAMALDLCVPPLALLTLLTMATWFAGVAVLGLGGGVLPLILSSVAISVLGLAVMLAWWCFGRSILSLKQLCHVPFYILAKLPVYFYFLVKRQSAWVRSKREGEP